MVGVEVQPIEQAQTLRTLVFAQVLSGAGLAAGVTVGALLAEDMLGTTSLAGIPSALFTVGSAGAAVLVGRISNARGRRLGLTFGYTVGAIGSFAVVLAAALGSVPFLLVALLIYGAGTATNLQARYAGADLATPEHRGRALSTVLVATTLGAVVGPNLVSVMGGFAESLGIPRLAGPFILAGTAYGAAALVLFARLRPDPLLLARQLAADNPDEELVDDQGDMSSATIKRGVAVSAAIMITSQIVMVAIMTMTPVHMKHHGHSIGATGFVIGAHIGGMYLPSPISGYLVDRFGWRFLAHASGVTLLLAGILSATVPVDSVIGLAVALAVLGLGWNFGLVAGTALTAEVVPLSIRAKTQGSIDLGIAIAGTAGGLGSGVIVAVSSYPILSVVGGLASLAVIPIIVFMVDVPAAVSQSGVATEAADGDLADRSTPE